MEEGDTQSRESPLRWVEDLFPPTFVLTSKDLEKEQGLHGNEEKTGDEGTPAVTEPEVRKGKIKISALDVSAIKNVYERVRVMTILEEEEKRKKEEQDEETKMSKGGICITAKNKSTQTEVCFDPEESVLWSSNEIDVLRGVFRAAKDQNLKLKLTLENLTQDLDATDTKYKRQRKVLESRNMQLQEVVKANQRLKIHRDSLQAQFDKASKSVEELNKNLSELQSRYSETLSNFHEIKLECERLKLAQKQSQVNMDNKTQELLIKQRISEENMKTMYENDIVDFQKEIVSLKEELTLERQAHEKSRKGLEHLRRHFCGIPSSSGLLSVVDKDELTDVKYYSNG